MVEVNLASGKEPLPRSTKFDQQIFEKLWNNHSVPTSRIAQAMGMTRQGVSWWAKNLGLPSRAHVRKQLFEEKLFREMWEAGVSTSDIARHFGAAHHSCSSVFARKMGLPKRTKGKSGKMNGGWAANITLQEFWELRLGRKMQMEARKGHDETP